MMIKLNKYMKLGNRQGGAAILEYIVLGAVLVLGLVMAVKEFRTSAKDALDSEGKVIKAVGGGTASAAKDYAK